MVHENSREDVIIERSFASEVASLLAAGVQSAPDEARSGPSTMHRSSAKPVAAIDARARSVAPLFPKPEGTTFEISTEVEQVREPLQKDTLFHSALREQPSETTKRHVRDGDAPETTHSSRVLANAARQITSGNTGELGQYGSLPQADASSERSNFRARADGTTERDNPRAHADATAERNNWRANADATTERDNSRAHADATAERDGYLARADAIGQQNIVVAANRFRPERAVPITRLPLRPQGFEITWPAQLPESARGQVLSLQERHHLLERLVRRPGGISSDTIAQAYREEEGAGRTIALRVLLRNFPEAGRSSFIEALRVGSDEERAVALDGLTAIGARQEMTPAFSDRVDAIAAKAALAYVGTFERADYRKQLSEFVDETQVDVILKMLAGIVE